MVSKPSFLILCIFFLLPSACMLKKDCVTRETNIISVLDQLSQKNETIEKMAAENRRIKQDWNQCTDALSKIRAEGSNQVVESIKTEDPAEIEKIKSRNKELEKIKDNLTDKISSLKFEIKKRDSIIELQENVIQLLDDTKKTIETSLKEQIAKKLFEIESTEDQVKMVFKDMILFSPGSLTIHPRGKQLLLKIAASVKAKKGQHITVEGHTDNTPVKKKYPTNWELSADRALAVVRFLNEVAGCDASKLSAVAYGSSRPVASNDTEEGRRKNRRIELIIHYPKPVK
jgi:flagellar motor protein MotB